MHLNVVNWKNVPDARNASFLTWMHSRVFDPLPMVAAFHSVRTQHLLK